MSVLKWIQDMFAPPARLVEPSPPISVDLANFRVGHTDLGSLPNPADYFAPHIKGDEDFDDEKAGLELGAKNGALDCAKFDISVFKGGFTLGGIPITLTLETKVEDVAAIFGEPYWVEEVERYKFTTVYYEYPGGVELQFDFEKGTLEFITFFNDGLLSDPVQRAKYGCTKPWPPQT